MCCVPFEIRKKKSSIKFQKKETKSYEMTEFDIVGKHLSRMRKLIWFGPRHEIL
jgi:hypothetical protein